MKLFTVDGIDLISLTYDEERDFAELVMDLLGDRRVVGRLSEICDRTFRIKSMTGYLSQVEEIAELFGLLERYQFRFPDWTDDGKDIWEEIDTQTYPSIEEKSEEARSMVIRIWREVWSSHDSIKVMADVYKVFPGDDLRASTVIDWDAYLAEQNAMEEAFWAEVERTMQEFECSRSDAYTDVRDRMPRGFDKE